MNLLGKLAITTFSGVVLMTKNVPFVKSRQGAEAGRAFMTLRSSSARGDAGAVKYGQLLSMLLTKSWPKTPQFQNTSGLDPCTVEFLLTWNPMAGYFRFFGK